MNPRLARLPSLLSAFVLVLSVAVALSRSPILPLVCIQRHKHWIVQTITFYLLPSSCISYVLHSAHRKTENIIHFAFHFWSQHKIQSHDFSSSLKCAQTIERLLAHSLARLFILSQMPYDVPLCFWHERCGNCGRHFSI